MNRILLVQIHTVLAGFFFVTGFLFLITGGLMTFGLKGEDETAVYPLHLSEPMPQDRDSLLRLAEQELVARHMSLPKGKAKMVEDDDKTVLEWEGAQRTVVLASTDNPMLIELTIENASLHRRLVNLHKADGGPAFKYVAAAWAIGLLTLLITGFIMAWQLPKFRGLAVQSMFVGAVVFIGALLLS